MTKAIKHIVEIHIQNIQGILVLDRKLHQQEDQRPRGLNKISAIASITRNKNVTTSGTSYPLQPSSNMHSSNGSYLYHANWNHSDAKDSSSRIALQTNLHPLPKQHQKHVNTTKFESKRFDVVIGLKRGNKFVVLATSLIHIDNEMANEEMTLPLIPIMAITSTSTNKSRTKGGDHHYDDPMIAFADDENRYFGLDAGAVLHCSVTVSSQSTWHYKKLEAERMMISSQKAPLFYDEDDTTVSKVNAKKEVLLQSRNPAINGDVTEESRDDIHGKESDNWRLRYDHDERFLGSTSTELARDQSFKVRATSKKVLSSSNQLGRRGSTPSYFASTNTERNMDTMSKQLSGFPSRRWDNFNNNLNQQDDDEENLDDLYDEDMFSILVNAMKCNAAKEVNGIAREPPTEMNYKSHEYLLSESNGCRCGAISDSLQQSYSDYSESYSAAESNEYSAFTDLE